MRQPKQSTLSPLISLKTISSKSQTLIELLSIAESRQSIDALLDSCLPALLQQHFKVSSLSENKLVLTCNSAKLMTKFRQIQDETIAKLNSLIHPKKVDLIQIKIRPSQMMSTYQSEKATLRQISKKNAQILLEEAEHTTDQNLKKALTNIANHAT